MEVEEADSTGPPARIRIALKYEFLSRNMEHFKRSASATPETNASTLPRMRSVSPDSSLKLGGLDLKLPEASLKPPPLPGMPDLSASYSGGGIKTGSLTLPSMPRAESLGSIVSSSNGTGRASQTTGKFRIRVISAENLPAADSAGDTNPFVRCFLLPVMGISGKRKTSVVPKTLNPVWEEECSYN